MKKLKKLSPQDEAMAASFKRAMEEARKNNCEHIDKEVIYDEKEDCWKDEFGGEAEPPFTCSGCGGVFCTECFGGNQCKGCEGDEI